MSSLQESANDQNTQSNVPRTLDEAIAALEKTNINRTSRNGENKIKQVDGDDTFVFDPNIVKRWDSGRGNAADEDEDDEDTKVPQVATEVRENRIQKSVLPVIDERPEATASSVQDQPAVEDAAAAGEAAEQTVTAAKNKKKKRKPKSKRGLV